MEESNNNDGTPSAPSQPSTVIPSTAPDEVILPANDVHPLSNAQHESPTSAFTLPDLQPSTEMQEKFVAMTAAGTKVAEAASVPAAVESDPDSLPTSASKVADDTAIESSSPPGPDSLQERRIEEVELDGAPMEASVDVGDSNETATFSADAVTTETSSTSVLAVQSYGGDVSTREVIGSPGAGRKAEVPVEQAQTPVEQLATSESGNGKSHASPVQDLRIDTSTAPNIQPHSVRSPSESSEEEGMLRVDEAGRLIDDNPTESTPKAAAPQPLHASFLPMIDPTADAPSSSSPATASAASYAGPSDFPSRQASYHDGSASPMPPRSAGWERERDYRRDREYLASRHDPRDPRDARDRESRDSGWADRSYVAPSAPRERLWSGDYRGEGSRGSRASPIERHFADRDRDWDRDHYSPARSLIGGRDRDLRGTPRGSGWPDRDWDRAESRRMRDDDRHHGRPSPATDVSIERINPNREFSPRRRWGSPVNNGAVPSPTVRSPVPSGSSAPSGSRPLSPAQSNHSRRTSSSQHANSPFAHNNGKVTEADPESGVTKRAASEERRHEAARETQRARMGWSSPRGTAGPSSQSEQSLTSLSKPVSPVRAGSDHDNVATERRRSTLALLSSDDRGQDREISHETAATAILIDTQSSGLSSVPSERHIPDPTRAPAFTSTADSTVSDADSGAVLSTDPGEEVKAGQLILEQTNGKSSDAAPAASITAMLETAAGSPGITSSAAVALPPISAASHHNDGPPVADEEDVELDGVPMQGEMEISPAHSHAVPVTTSKNFRSSINPIPSMDSDRQDSPPQTACLPTTQTAPALHGLNGVVAGTSVDLKDEPMKVELEDTAFSTLQDNDQSREEIAMDVDPPIEAVLVDAPPTAFPVSQEERERMLRAATRRIAAKQCLKESDFSNLVCVNRKLAELTTFNVLESPVYGPPQLKDEQIWLDRDDPSLQPMKDRLTIHLTTREQRLAKKLEALREQYKTVSDEWDGHCQRLDKIKERSEAIKRQMQPSGPLTPIVGASASIPNSVDDNGSTTGLLAAGSTRHNRRSMQSGFGFGDAVRSEAEFLEILASLESADMQDPNMRAARTTVAVPDMTVDPDSQELCKSNLDDTNGFVADPIAYYLSDLSADHWTEEEQVLFEKRYILFPKQFGRIAAGIPDKSPSQCVVYYYNNKKNPHCDFKTLAAARSRDRKKKSRVKPRKAKGSALIADLKIPRGEEGDDGTTDFDLPRKRTRPSMSGRMDSSLSRLEEEDERDGKSAGTKRRADDGEDGGEKRTRTKSAKRAKGERKTSAAGSQLASPSTSVQSHSGMATPVGFSDSAAVDVSGTLSGILGGASAPDLLSKGKRRKVPNDDGSAKRSRATTSSYWSIAERNEFLRSLIINGKDWNSIATSLSTKSATQARNYFTRNAEETVFAEAAILATDNANEALEIRQEAAETFAKRMLSGDDSAASTINEAIGITTEVEASEGSRGLRINSLLNEETSSDRERKKTSLQDWFGSGRSERDERVSSPPPRDVTRERERELERARQIEQLRDRGSSYENSASRRDASLSEMQEREHREYVDVRDQSQRHQWNDAAQIMSRQQQQQQQHLHQQTQNVPQTHYGARRSSIPSPVHSSMPPPSSYSQSASIRERPLSYQYAVPSHSHYSERSSMEAGSHSASQLPSSRRSPDRNQQDQRYSAMGGGQLPRQGGYEQRNLSGGWSPSSSAGGGGLAMSSQPPHRYSSPIAQPLPSPYGASSRSLSVPGSSSRTSASPSSGYERSPGPPSLGSYSPYSQHAASQPPQHVQSPSHSSSSTSYGSVPMRDRFSSYPPRPSGLGSQPPQLPPPSRTATSTSSGYGPAGMPWSHQSLSPHPPQRSPSHRPPPGS